MKNIIEIDRLNFQYQKNKVLKNLSLNIREGSFTTILGLNGSGKTTLIKLMLGLLRGNAVILCEGIPNTKENLMFLRKDIGAIYEKPEEHFVNETVMDEIAFTLENLNLPKEEIRKKVNSVAYKLKIKKILEKEPNSLNAQDKWLTALASALVTDPKILIIDNGFSSLNPRALENVLNVLKKLKADGMTIINATCNVEESLYGDEVILLDDGKVLLAGFKEEVLSKEEVFDEIGMEMPFIVSLSSKLRFYDLIKDNYYSEEELVDALWK